MFLLAGIGNPGAAYDGTRHNIGFAVVERVAHLLGAEPFRQQKKNRLSKARLPGGGDCLLVMPQTFMNLSGEGVGPLARFYKLQPEQILIVHDELDFPLGQVRFKLHGGHGGHNGLRSLLAHIPSDFARLRVGIGGLGSRVQQIDFVLGRFRPEEQGPMQDSIDVAAKAAILAMQRGFEAAMRDLHKPPPRPGAAAKPGSRP